ncbi:hypothetical protein [Haloechinothrix alba]|uniref:hypothetical protein n=1 Tax=Haloechinothrix alba TaxID=664784 RepID=UPI001130117C|nr:hypothetical protein [Haloechinothrix alba]
MTSAVIRDGGITLLENSFLRMVSSDDVEIVYIGPDSDGQQIFRLRRDNGEVMLLTQRVDEGRDFWSLWDNDGNIIMSDDAASGSGLARPWLPVILYPKFISNTTGSETGQHMDYWSLGNDHISGETEMWEGRATISHPYIEVDGTWGPASGSATVTYRLRLDGTEVGSWSEGSGVVTGRQGPFDVSSFVRSDHVRIALTAEVSTTTDSSACSVWACYLRQS